MKISCPATSYVAATFHPTIGQLCSSISQHNCHPRAGHNFHKEKGTISSHNSQIHIKVQPRQYTVGFIRLLRKWKGRIAKLVSSTIELWTPLQYLSSLAFTILQTQNKEVFPSLLHSPSGHTFPSSVLSSVNRGLTNPS